MINAKGIVLMFVCIGIAFYLKLDWLGYLLILFLVLVALGTSRRPMPRPVAVPTGGGGQADNRDTIYPVIYEDIGSPYLYSPKTKIKISPMWRTYRLDEWAAEGLGHMVRSGVGILRKGRKLGE